MAARRAAVRAETVPAPIVPDTIDAAIAEQREDEGAHATTVPATVPGVGRTTAVGPNESV
jgi:hypothetical protein